MAIEMQGFRIKSAQLRNEQRAGKTELEIRYDYKCDVSENKPHEIQCFLHLQVYAQENNTAIDQSPLYISAEVAAKLASTDTIKSEEASSEALRLLFPFVQAYIVQLTASSNMPPLYLPYSSIIGIMESNELQKKEEKKRSSKAHKQQEK